MISNPLNDIVPAKYRKTVYAVIALAALAFSVWQASEGNIELFIGSFIVSLSHATAASNTSTEALPDDNYIDGHADEVVDDALAPYSYDEN